MSQKFEKLKTLLKELFQLDQPELDFGIYRVLHARSAEVTQFLEQDLLPQVKAAFEQYRPADKAAIQKELDNAIEQARELGADPETLPKVKDLRKRLAEDAVDLDALEAEVYDHLYSFFRRYYSEGDFLSKRVYKPGVYAIPYEGEEVKLHWANADQYYIKTSEYLRDYAFRLRPDDEKNPMRVHFRLVDAAEGEHGNVKEQAGRERRFKLALAPFAAVEDGELVIRFTYEPDPSKQKDLNAEAEAAILGLKDASFADWIKALAAKHVRADGTVSDSTRLRVHLDRYTARNTFDYFIHKDLGGFLRRELDFYIKNEVMHLDDIENESAPRVEQYLSKIKVIRRIAHKIIDFLAQLEDFQKKLWLKKKFVVETSWCIRLGVIPEAFYPEIAANDAQREEWVRLHAIDALKATEGSLLEPGKAGYSVPLTVEFLKAHPTLMVDTRHFDGGFTAQVLEAIGDLDEQTDGVLFHSENFQALSLMQARYRERVKCIYIDPPYNSKTSEIAYKNNYKHSSWITLMENRLTLSRTLSCKSGSHVIAIDENEQEVLGQLLSILFPTHEKICIAVVHNKKGIQGKYFSHNHEYAYFVIPQNLPATHGARIPPDEWEYTNLRKWGRESERSTAKNCFYPIFVQDQQIVGFGEVCDEAFHPGGSNVADGSRTFVYPVDAAGVERKWRYARSSVEAIRHLLKVHITATGEVQILKAVAERPIKTVWDDARYIAGDYGTKWLTELALKVKDDLYPKSVHLVEDSIYPVTDPDDFVLDYFAGSGTTGHALINLNRKDGGHRKFLLVEMGEYFDTVLVPRVKKLIFAPEWTEGKPKRLATAEETERSPRVVKIIHLESYEDTLNNLDLRRTKEQQRLLTAAEAQGTDRLREQYLLRYLLDVETRGSQSLLNVGAFTDPTAYMLKVKRPGSDESRETNVDLIETFNWLIGLTVRKLAAPQTLNAETERDSEGRLRLKGPLRQEARGPWWFRTVTGTVPDGRQTLVIWRKRPGGETPDGLEQDNLILDEWFIKQGYSGKDSAFELIYVNGDNNLENLKSPGETWKVCLIEEVFFRMMFETKQL
ncbi:MAG TPA: DNA methyltransferase [Burkholderiales bacterium]|nr:DNA methyltransferase [Burkholderiales bacterium]